MIFDGIAHSIRSWFETRSNISLDARIWADMGWLNNSSSGVTVTPESAMRVSAVYACVRLLSDTIAQLPINIIRENSDGTTDKANNENIAVVLRTKPNEWQTPFEWRQMMMAHLCLRGNAYSRIVAGAMGSVSQLIPLHPGRMEIERQVGGQYGFRYKYTNLQGVHEYYSPVEMFHLRGLSSDGVLGLNPIQLARDTIGLASAMEQYGAGLYKNGARPAAIIKHPGRLNELAANKLRERWERIHAGVDNAGKTAVLEEGMTVETLGMTSEDAQYIESRKFQANEIARIFRVPPHMIADLDRATFSNIEHMSLDFVRFTMGPWIRLWEDAVKRDLISGDGLFLKFNLNGLLRGDSTARAQFYNTMFSIGAFSPNDILALEDMDPVEGGDQRFVPLNMVPLAMAEQKAQADMTTPEPAASPADQADQSRALSIKLEDTSVKIAALQASTRTATEHCLAIMVDAASRMISWEVGAVQRAAKKANFLTAIDEFYDGHMQRFVSAMSCPCELYRALTGTEVPCMDIVKAHIAESREALLAAAGRTTKQTISEEVATITDEWPSRVSKWTMIGTDKEGITNGN